jgi:FixJ family two-component response regulator
MNSMYVAERSGKSTALVVPNVFVIDKDATVRETLRQLIGIAGWRACTFSSAQEFLSRPRALTPSCLIMDVAPQDLSGLEVQKRVAHRSDMPVIFIANCAEVSLSVQAMKAGALEFLMKPFHDEVLLNTIRHALGLSQAELERESRLRELRDQFALLSPREREVMMLVVSGRLNKQIGWELGICEDTVKAHRGKVMRKMGADSVADLVMLAAKLCFARWPKAFGFQYVNDSSPGLPLETPLPVIIDNHHRVVAPATRI